MRIGVFLLGFIGASRLGVLSAHANETKGPDVAVSEASASEAPAGKSVARERARRLFEQGIALYREGRFAEALESFQEAQDTYGSPTVTFNLARTCDQLEEAVCALRHYREYQRQAPEAPEGAEVGKRILALEAILVHRGVQQITVFSSPPSVALTIDGVELGTTPWTGELVPGTHRIRLTGSGYSDVEVDIDVPRAHAIERHYEMRRVEPIPALPPPVPVSETASLPRPVPSPGSAQALPRRNGEESSTGSVGTWTYAVLGAGAASLASAVLFEVLRRDSENDVRELPVQSDRVEAYDTMGDYQVTARVFAGVGLGLAAIGATLLVFDLGSPTPSQGSTAARIETRGFGLTLQGTR